MHILEAVALATEGKWVCMTRPFSSLPWRPTALGFHVYHYCPTCMTRTPLPSSAKHAAEDSWKEFTLEVAKANTGLLSAPIQCDGSDVVNDTDCYATFRD